MKHRKLTTGFYVPTESFKSIPKHIAVMFEDDRTLVAICGAADDDPENVLENMCQARKFAAVDDLLEALKAYKDNHSEAAWDIGVDARMEFPPETCDCDLCIVARAVIEGIEK